VLTSSLCPLRHRAGLPPLVVGAGALNHGHQLLLERELLILHDVLPEDSEMHDGLQLVNGGSPHRHVMLTVEAPTPAQVVPRAPAAAPASVVPAVVGALPPGVPLPPPPHPMRLDPLSPYLTHSGAAPAAIAGLSW